MAQIRWPTISASLSVEDWAERLVATLQRNMGSTIDPIQVGQMVLFPNPPGVPIGYLPCNGSSFSQKVYPALWQFLGSGTLPTLAGPGGFVYGIKAT